MADTDRSGGPEVRHPPTRPCSSSQASCLAIPIVALLWVGSYARETPRLGGFPFFFWYQFLWVFICAGLTYAAHRLVLAARKPGRRHHRETGPIGDTDPAVTRGASDDPPRSPHRGRLGRAQSC